MTTKTEAAAPVAKDASDKTTARSDQAVAFVRQFLSNHGIAVETFTDAEGLALVEAIDAAK